MKNHSKKNAGKNLKLGSGQFAAPPRAPSNSNFANRPLLQTLAASDLSTTFPNIAIPKECAYAGLYDVSPLFNYAPAKDCILFDSNGNYIREILFGVQFMAPDPSANNTKHPGLPLNSIMSTAEYGQSPANCAYIASYLAYPKLSSVPNTYVQIFYDASGNYISEILEGGG